jgi:hypothetical protein
MITNDARCRREIKSRIAMTKKKSFLQEEVFFRQQNGLKFKEETSKVATIGA